MFSFSTIFWMCSTASSGFNWTSKKNSVLHSNVDFYFKFNENSNCFLTALLSIISNQSAHSPLTSTRHFRPHNCRSLDIFSFSEHSLETQELVVCENPSRSAIFEILRSARLAPTTIPRSKSLKSPFFPVLMLGLNFSKSSSPHLDA